LKLTKHIQEQLNSPDSNMLHVEDYLTFISPRHASGLFLALRVRHKQSGLRYVQLVHLPIKIANELGDSLIAHAEMAQSSEPDF
jgi:hypothetical protein